MRSLLIALTLVLATITYCNAQQIQMEKAFGGYKFSQEGKQLSMGDLVKTMESNQEAFDLMKKAKSNTGLATVFGFAGGALIGWPLGTAIGGGEPNWTLAGIGAGLVVIGIPISVSANKKAKQAIDLYNSSLNSTSFQEVRRELEFRLSSNGIGFLMSF